MIIKLEHINEIVNKLKEVEKNPSIIFTEIFDEKQDYQNFYYTIIFSKGESFQEYIVSNIKKMDIFKNLNVQKTDFGIYDFCVKPIPFENELEDRCYLNNKIFQIDIPHKTYSILTNDLLFYEKCIIEKIKKITPNKLDETWSRFVNLNYKKRIVNAISSLKENTSFYIHISNLFFWLFYPKRKMEEKLNFRINELNKENKYLQQNYEKKITSQKMYQKYAPAQIDLIKKEQKNLCEYFETIGYIQKPLSE